MFFKIPKIMKFIGHEDVAYVKWRRKYSRTTDDEDGTRRARILYAFAV